MEQTVTEPREVGTIRLPNIGSDGMTLRGLRGDAKITASWRGHDMARFDRYSVSTCRTCKAWVQVNARPAANGIDIGGPAIAVDCR